MLHSAAPTETLISSHPPSRRPPDTMATLRRSPNTASGGTPLGLRRSILTHGVKADHNAPWERDHRNGGRNRLYLMYILETSSIA